MGKKNNIDELKTTIIEEVKTNLSIEDAVESFRVALENAPIPMVLHAEDGEVLLMSKSTLEATGYDFSEIDTLSKWTAKVHRDRKEYNDEFVKRSFEKGIQVQGEEEPVYTKSGAVRIWAFHNSLLGKLSDGRKLIITTMVDVTEERNAQGKLEGTISKLQQTEAILKASMESQKDFIVIMLDRNFEYLYFNENHKIAMKQLYNIDIEIGMSLIDNIKVEQDRLVELERYNRALQGESFSVQDQYGKGHDQFFETHYGPIQTTDKEIIGISIFTSNITKQIMELRRVQESEEKFRLIYSAMSQGLAVHELVFDKEGNPYDYSYIEVNDSYLNLFGYEKDQLIGKNVSEVAPLLEKYWYDSFFNVALTGEPKYLENYSSSVGKYLSVYAYSPKQNQFAVLISDITERVEKEKEIQYLSLNDQLTGVYNRRYYEEQLIALDKEENYPLSLIMGDVNGLKLVNDSFGHQVGDELLIKVADILRKSCRNTDIITRIGGDEFVIMLPNTDIHQSRTIVDRIRHYSSQENIKSIEVSISFGYGTKSNKGESITRLFKQIEDDMYRNKLNDTKSMRSNTIDLIMTTLYEKNEREMFHSKRVGAYCEKFAIELGLTKEEVNQIKNAGLMHDIGKIGVDEQILNKTGGLTKKELKEVQKHAEIGFRILSSVYDFTDIANHILEHHERYDGLGYPNGLMGEEISLQARIINIVDSFDAMTGPRPYKEPITREQAITELIRCKGAQFDPELVDIFIQKVLE